MLDAEGDEVREGRRVGGGGGGGGSEKARGTAGVCMQVIEAYDVLARELAGHDSGGAKDGHVPCVEGVAVDEIGEVGYAHVRGDVGADLADLVVVAEVGAHWWLSCSGAKGRVRWSSRYSTRRNRGRNVKGLMRSGLALSKSRMNALASAGRPK